jgi:hypothetical protein
MCIENNDEKAKSEREHHSSFKTQQVQAEKYGEIVKLNAYIDCV